MDWHSEDKFAAWEIFTTGMKLYYSMAHTKEETKVDNILFFGGNEATDRWTTLKDQVSAEDQLKPDKVFTVFTNSFEKSSSHWQARDEYLCDIKQGRQQTTAELDIYIKDLVRRCQFPIEEAETCKVNLLHGSKSSHAAVDYTLRLRTHRDQTRHVANSHILKDQPIVS